MGNGRMSMNKALRDIKAIPDRIRQHYLKKRIGKRWAQNGSENLLARQYDSYDDTWSIRPPSSS